MAFFFRPFFAQNIDSAKQVLASSKNDLTTIKTLSFLSDNAGDSIYTAQLKTLSQKLINASDKYLALEAKKGLALALNNDGIDHKEKLDLVKAKSLMYEALNIRLSINDQAGVGESYYNLGYLHENREEDSAFFHFNKSYEVRLKINDSLGIAKCLYKIGNYYYGKGNYTEALNFYFRSLVIQEKTGNQRGTAITLRNIALIQLFQADTTSALKNLLKAKDISEKINYTVGVFHTLSDLGSIYKERNDTTNALIYYRKALSLVGDHLRGQALSYLDIGTIYLANNREEVAFRYLSQSQAIFEKLGDLESYSAASRLLAGYYIHKKNNAKAKELLNKCLMIGRQTGMLQEIKFASYDLYKIYNAENNHKAALEMYQQHIAVKDSLQNDQLRKDAIRKQYEYDYGKKETEIKARADADKQRIEEVAKKDKEKQQLVIYFISAGLVLVIVFALFIFNRFKITQKQKAIIEQKEKQTQEQNVIISRQKELVEEKQKEILDSIRYAKRIQNSLLPTDKYIDKVLTRSKKS